MRSNQFQKIETERLFLRKLQESDFESIIFLRSNELVNKYVQRPKASNKEQALEFINKIEQEVGSGNSYYWSISLKPEEKMIGSICLWNFSEDRTIAEVGYDLKPKFQHKGIMNEAMQAVLNFGFKKLKLSRIEAFTHFENESSKRLLLRNHFELNRDRKDENNPDCLIFEIKK